MPLASGDDAIPVNGWKACTVKASSGIGKAIAEIVKRRGKIICAISSAGYLQRTAIEEVIAVETHRGVRNGCDSVTR